MNPAKNCAAKTRFAPCTASVSLLEQVRGLASRLETNLPPSFLRKTSGRNNQKPNQIESSTERTRQRHTNE
jgi:hypothetical protein